MTKVWILCRVAFENDSYFDNLVRGVFLSKPDLKTIMETLDITEEVAQDLSNSTSADDEYGQYYIQETNLN